MSEQPVPQPFPAAFSLAGRVAVVTGAGGGLGRGISVALAGAGASVVAAGRTHASLADTVSEIEVRGGQALAAVADVRDEASVTAMIATATARYGGVDILVNNAAIYPRRAWTEITRAEWDQVIGTNLTAYFTCARAAYPSLAERGHGRIINLASITMFGGWSMLLDYVSAKGGVLGFTRALAREIGPHGVTVNAISPGAFPTDAEKIHPDPAGYNAQVLAQQSIKRRGTPDDIGNLAVFLASDAASFITGQLIEIDGGWVMH